MFMVNFSFKMTPLLNVTTSDFYFRRDFSNLAKTYFMPFVPDSIYLTNQNLEGLSLHFLGIDKTFCFCFVFNNSLKRGKSGSSSRQVSLICLFFY